MSDARPSRFPVDVVRDAEPLDAELARLERHRPSGASSLVSPFGFSYRREPDVFAAVGIGAAFGMGILLIEFSLTVAYYSVVARVIAGASFVTAAWLIARFVRNFGARTVISADGDELVVRHTVFGRELGVRRFSAGTVIDVRVVKDQGASRVVLGGPRHEVLGEVYRLRALDPETLAEWFARMTVVVARRAGVAR